MLAAGAGCRCWRVAVLAVPSQSAAPPLKAHLRSTWNDTCAAETYPPTRPPAHLELCVQVVVSLGNDGGSEAIRSDVCHHLQAGQGGQQGGQMPQVRQEGVQWLMLTVLTGREAGRPAGKSSLSSTLPPTGTHPQQLTQRHPPPPINSPLPAQPWPAPGWRASCGRAPPRGCMSCSRRVLWRSAFSVTCHACQAGR